MPKKKNEIPDHLWEAVQQNDPKAIETITKACEHWVSNIAKYLYGKMHKSLPSSIEMDDLKSEGLLGLYQAITRFKPEEKCTFYTFAQRRIRGQMMDFIRDSSLVPRQTQRKIKTMKKARTALRHELNREPTDAEITQRMEIGEEEYREIAKAARAAKIISLEETQEENPEADPYNIMELASKIPFEDLLVQHQEQLESQEIMDRYIRSAFPTKTREVLFFICRGHAYPDIAEMYGVSESRISQIFTRAVRRIKHHLTQLIILRQISGNGIIRPPGSIMPIFQKKGIMEKTKGDGMSQKAEKKQIEMQVISRVVVEIPADKNLTIEALLGLGATFGIRMVGQTLESVSIINPGQPVQEVKTKTPAAPPKQKERGNADEIDAEATMKRIRKMMKGPHGGSVLDKQGAKIIEDLMAASGKYGTIAKLAQKYQVNKHTMYNWLKARIVYKAQEGDA